jgi:hypothetical protein
VYQPRTPGFTKRDPMKRWSVPDRVFFACGSCHILAHAFLERYGTPEHEVTWIKPAAGYWGNHVFVSAADWVFDFHGYSRREASLRMSGSAAARCGRAGTPRSWPFRATT